MPIKRYQRLIIVLLVMLSLGGAVSLVLYAMRQNISLFYTPTQVVTGMVSAHSNFRIGGLVQKGSVHYSKQGAEVAFRVQDYHHGVNVVFRGLLPDLFREGQGIVAQGHLNTSGVFVADQVLAKHDENYKPPEVVAALKR
jgi:cytochrome c-type biogenesis protein CcmE